MATKKPDLTPEQHAGITERAKFYIKKLAESFGVDDATVTDVISGKKMSLAKRKKQIEGAGQDVGKFGTPIDLP